MARCKELVFAKYSPCQAVVDAVPGVGRHPQQRQLRHIGPVLKQPSFLFRQILEQWTNVKI